MEPQEYEIMYRAERRHWWYRGMESIARSVINRWYRPGSALRILDAGCGTGGAMTSYLSDYGQVTGIDLSEAALGYCRRRGAQRLARASVERLPFASEAFDLVTSFEVLYERGVPDDSTALDELFRSLAGGGRLLLRLPAYDWLRGRHDDAVHTARRYTARRVSALLRRTGLTIEHLSYVNMFLFPFAAIKRSAERILPARPFASDLTLNPGPLNGLFRAVLAAEAPLVSRTSLPFGLSVIAVGRKSNTG